MQDSTQIPEPKLLDQVRGKIRLKHYSIRTEQAYLDWIKRFVLHFGKRHPRDMGAAEVEQFFNVFGGAWQCGRFDTKSSQERAVVSLQGGVGSGASLAG